jgi:hypothetical protein
MMKAGFLSLALCAALVPDAYAQMTWTDKAFVNVTGGAQAGSHTLATSAKFDLYDEQGTLNSSQSVKGGGFFDVSGGYKVRRNLAAGIGYSWSGSKKDAAFTALVPDPRVFDQPRSVSATAADQKHTENAIHLFAAWMVPVTDKVDLGIQAGPSIFMVKQDIPSALSVSEPGPTVTQVTTDSSTKTGVGFNLGLDVTYLMSKRWGIGALARYTGGSVNFENATDNLNVGGFQIGAGVRFRFQ